ncbi:Kinesin motor domain [Trypanosoma melophagium]|uniref:Kinesin motor domain n=1 Tax=Trypanosoma melophagium TaxID=715481 RepID=UPI00351A3872|nr:Kinesin motor domain [Trypanosoma melophagium]
MSGVSPMCSAPSSARPPSSRPTSARPTSVTRNADREFRRMQSARSLTTPRRSAIDIAQAQGSAMKVYVRVRPFSERELSLNMPQHSTVRIDVDNPCLITILDPHKEFRPRETFSFTKCFWSVLERNNDSGKSAEEIRGTIDAFINTNTPSARTRGSRTGSFTAAPNNSGLLSARGRIASENGATFDGAGSSAVVVNGSTVVHPPYSSQKDVYNEVGRPVLDNTLEGYNGCVFAYGQTGSGKTFTILGYAPRNSDFRSASKRQLTTMDDDDDDYDEYEGSKPPVVSVSPARYRRASVVSNPGSRQDLFGRQMSSQANGDRNDVDVVDTTALDPNELQGIIPRICTDLFNGLRDVREKDPSHSYRVEVEYYEIYNEKVYDLIRPQKDADLKIRHNPLTGPYVEDLTSKMVANEEQIAKVIRKGSVERHTAATKINDRSSRSHAILTLNILQLYLDESGNTCKKQSKLNLVDLAGSERTGAVGAEGKQFLEGTKINLSLTTLGRVIDCLADLSQSKSLAVPVPYRDSNLTWLLMDSLGGNSKTSMVATISPHCINFDEMRQTIRYASRAKQIVNKAVINEDPQVRQIKMLTAEVERLKKFIRDAGYNEFSRDYVLELQRRNAYLEKRCEEQEMTIAELRAQLEENGIVIRTEDLTTASARRAGAGQPESSASRRRGGGNAEESNGSLLRSRLGDSKAEVDELRRQISESNLSRNGESPTQDKRVAELNARIKSLKKELDVLRKNDLKKERFLERFAFFYMDWASDTVHNTMLLKEKEYTKYLSRFVINQNDNLTNSLRRLRQSHREEVDNMQKRHVSEMEDLQKLSESRLKESIERSSELYQQLIDKHVEKINHTEERMKKNKEFYGAERKRLENEKENMRNSYDDQVRKMRAEFQDELKRLREQISAGAHDRQRSGEAIKRAQEGYEKELLRRQEEMDRYRREKEHEISRLKQQIENEALRRESDILEKDRQRRLLEQEVIDMRRELLKVQAQSHRLEEEHQAEILRLTQQQERLVSIGSGLLADWDNRPHGLDASFSKLRDILQSQEYISVRNRLREATFERKDYTAELEAVEERKRRDTQRLREIVQQLKQNQEESKASLQRFEEDVMKHLAKANRIRHGKSNGSVITDGSSSSTNGSFGSLRKDQSFQSNSNDGKNTPPPAPASDI